MNRRVGANLYDILQSAPLNKEHIAAEYNNAERAITKIQILNYAMVSEYFSLIDLLEEQGKLCHQIKRCANKSVIEYDKYRKRIEDSFEKKDALYLLFDICISALQNVESQINDMQATFFAHIAKEYKIKDAWTVSKAAIPIAIFNVIEMHVKSFLDKYKPIRGINAEYMLERANVRPVFKHINDIYMILCCGKRIDVTSDKQCMISIKAFELSILGKDNMEASAHKSLKYMFDNKIKRI